MMLTLMHALSHQDQGTACLSVGREDMTVAELQRRAMAVRQRVASVAGRRIALLPCAPEDFVLSLVALDGFARAVFVVPRGLAEDVQARLIERSDCDLIFRAENCAFAESVAQASEANGPADGQTQWILATSGTTGQPKLVSHTLRSLAAGVRGAGRYGAGLTWGLMYDPSRFAGLQVVLQALMSACVLVLPASLEFEVQVAALIDRKIDALSATPSMWRKLLMDGRIRSLDLRQVTLGGEIADQGLLDALTKTFPRARVVHIYASTEAGVGFSVKDRLAGFPAAWLDNADAPVLLRVRGDGHLLVKPPQLACGEEVTLRTDSEGYFDTQDLVVLQNGRCIFRGRASGAINVGGNKVHPEELEGLLRQIPEVHDLRVFGRQSSVLGQLVAVEVVALPGAELSQLRDVIQAFCRARLEPWQRPAFITFVDQLGESAAGKLLRVG